MPAQMRLLALRLADGLAEAAQQRQILLPEAGMTCKTESKPGMASAVSWRLTDDCLVYINLPFC